MTPVVCIVGTSDSGKTTLICRLIEELSKRGYRVATIKHHHAGFEMDHEGTDTFKHWGAGARQVIISGPQKMALIRAVDPEPTLEDLAALYGGGYDLLLAEGFKNSTSPKIEIWRTGQPDETLLCAGDPHCLALATDFPHDVEVPVLDLNWPDQVADFIETRFLKETRPMGVRLAVDGRPIPLNKFASRILESVVRGAVASLRGCESPKHIVVEIESKT